ncbi:centrosomal protein [Caerostris darwini]|uniref:Centrosomal protein n=1 Tax=Caerostris darwini TaxID=1538125 RepID=A0AAV4PRU0_9ARAC|nr:centrosomal protein [Caerostris darwini]
MDVGISSIGISNFKDDISHNEAEVEAAVLADQEIQEQEIDADLEKAFDGLCGLNTSESEIETESEDDDEIGNSHNTRSYVSQQDDFSSAFSEHKRNLSDSISRDDELENRLRKVDSYSGTGHSYANSSEKHSHFVPTSQSYDEYEGTSVAEHTNYNLAEPDYHKDNKKYASDVNSSEDYKNSVSVNPAFSAAMTNSAVDLQEEYRKLCIIYETTCQELTQLKREEINYRKETDQTIRTLKLNMDLIESEKKKLTSALQESQNLVSSYLQDKNTLLGKVTAVESQLSSMTKVKEEFQSKLEGSEVTIQLLEKQLCEFNRSGNMSRLRDHHNSILEEMKLRHEKDILHYRQNIDELQVELNSKVQETEELTSKNSELYHNYQQLQIEKAEWVNKMSSELEKAQRKCQQYLELGTIEEVNRLKLQVQRLEEEKSNIERENSSLRDEIKSLKTELNTAEALQKLTFSKPDACTGRQRDLNLHQELESSLKNVRSLRSEKHSLKKQLKDTENELENLRKRADLFESQFIESEKKVNELEEKLKSFSSNESMSIQLYEKKINSLESELSDLKINLHDTTEKLKQTVLSEKILHESNEEMQKKMTELVQKHIADKIQAVEMCREQLLELHENALQKEKDKIIIKANAELKDICFKYENKISEMQKGMKALNDGLYDSKNQYLALYKENQNLQEKFDEISKPKEREEIENEIRLDYERKLNEIKAQLIKQNEEYLTEHFKAELEKAEIEWTSKKMADIKVFVENTKQRLDDEFQSCLQKEQTEFQKKLETEKKRLYKEYEENMENLKKKFEEQKTELNAKLNKDIQNEWGKKISKLNENHEKEINSIQFQFDNKLQQMENEIKSLKERLSVKSNENEEVQKLKQEFMLQQEKLQREKDAFVSAEIVLNENIKKLTESENKLHDKIKKYQRHVASVKNIIKKK